MVIFDVDGVLTDGRLFLGDDGMEYKAFNSHDGLGMKKEALDALIQSFSDKEPDPKKSFGLKNVNTRLQSFWPRAWGP